MPIAASCSPAIAIGCVWWGIVGGGFPDWFDLRSDFRKPLQLRHRGASHGIPVALLLTAILWGALTLLSEIAFAPWGISLTVPSAAILPWTLCFLLGVLTHLLSDACTVSGIRPFLPFWGMSFWLLPGVLRCRHDGYLNRVLTIAALAVIGLTLVVTISDHLPGT